MNALTVLGPVPGADLGLTLMHEHLVFDFMCCLEEARTPAEREMAQQSVNIEILGALRFNPCLVPDNLVQDDVELAIEEVSAFTAVGGQTLVDPSNVSLGRDPLALQAISPRASVEAAFEPALLERSAPDLLSPRAKKSRYVPPRELRPKQARR